MKYLTIIPKELNKWYNPKQGGKKIESSYTSKLILESPFKTPWNKEIIIMPVCSKNIIYLKGIKPSLEDLSNDKKRYALSLQLKNESSFLIAKENEFHAVIPLYNKHYLQIGIILNT